MTFSARTNGVYHLWFHPHNFASHINEMFDQLEEILMHFHFLRKSYPLESYTMADISSENRIYNDKVN